MHCFEEKASSDANPHNSEELRFSFQCPSKVSGPVCIHVDRWSVVSLTLFPTVQGEGRSVWSHFCTPPSNPESPSPYTGNKCPRYARSLTVQRKVARQQPGFPFFLTYRLQSLLGWSRGDVPRSSNTGHALKQASNAWDISPSTTTSSKRAGFRQLFWDRRWQEGSVMVVCSASPHL